MNKIAMKIIVSILTLCLTYISAFSQNTRSNLLPLNAASWDFKPDKVKFSIEKSTPQMRMYVNSPGQPTLEVEKLEGNPKHGSIAFEGDMTIRNLIVKQGETENLPASPGMDPTFNDPRYVRNWAVSEPIVTPEKVTFSDDFLPTVETKWQLLDAERRGLVNLTRVFGKSTSRRLAWLKVKITSDKVQQKKVDFGFIDYVWIYLNGQITYVDQNLYGRPIAKTPDGRCSIENTNFILPFKKGVNELLIGVANDFFAWGVIARFEDLEGIEISPDPSFDSRIVKISGELLDPYIGTFELPTGEPVMLTRESVGLRMFAKGIVDMMLYPLSENKLFSRDQDMEFEFVKNGNSSVNKVIVSIYSEGKQLMELKRVEPK